MSRLAAPPAAAWVRVALQLNPYAYVIRHGHACGHASEDEYNAAIVAALRAASVGLVAITDHFRYLDSLSLAATVAASGISVLPAFEACTSEGVHLLVLLPDGTPTDKVQELIWKCELQDAEAVRATASLGPSATA
jgi:predicted metal-dependent phosphoesterase TrpH